MARQVAVFLPRDNQGRVLLQHRESTRKVLPDHWGFFGGKIEAEETPEQAVRREAREELQIELQDLTFFTKHNFTYEGNLYAMHIYLTNLQHKIETLRKMQKEGDDLKLFSKEEISSLKMAHWDREILEKIFSLKK